MGGGRHKGLKGSGRAGAKGTGKSGYGRGKGFKGAEHSREAEDWLAARFCAAPADPPEQHALAEAARTESLPAAPVEAASTEPTSEPSSMELASVDAADLREKGKGKAKGKRKDKSKGFGDAESSTEPKDLLRWLTVGSWQDHQGSTYALSVDSNGVITLATTRPHGQVIRTKGLVRTDVVYGESKIVWGKEGARNVFFLEKVRESACRWINSREWGNSFEWHRTAGDQGNPQDGDPIGPERRVDPEDGVSKTFDEVVTSYKRRYPMDKIQAYWDRRMSISVSSVERSSARHEGSYNTIAGKWTYGRGFYTISHRGGKSDIMEFREDDTKGVLRPEEDGWYIAHITAEGDDKVAYASLRLRHQVRKDVIESVYTLKGEKPVREEAKRLRRIPDDHKIVGQWRYGRSSYSITAFEGVLEFKEGNVRGFLRADENNWFVVDVVDVGEGHDKKVAQLWLRHHRDRDAVESVYQVANGKPIVDEAKRMVQVETKDFEGGWMNRGGDKLYFIKGSRWITPGGDEHRIEFENDKISVYADGSKIGGKLSVCGKQLLFDDGLVFARKQTAFRVMDCGSSACNGLYQSSEVSAGRIVYKQVGGKYEMMYNDNWWFLASDEEMMYSAENDSIEPPASGWVEGESGKLPVPTVSTLEVDRIHPITGKWTYGDNDVYTISSQNGILAFREGNISGLLRSDGDEWLAAEVADGKGQKVGKLRLKYHGDRDIVESILTYVRGEQSVDEASRVQEAKPRPVQPVVAKKPEAKKVEPKSAPKPKNWAELAKNLASS